jgi:hypothetical protein
MASDRDMMFIDGSNFLRQLAKKLEVRELRNDKPPPKAVVDLARTIFSGGPQFRGGPRLVRRYWFGSFVGDDTARTAYAESIRAAGFEPRLYKQDSEGREKGVDLGLAKEMLVNAFNRNYDRAVLVAGDADYEELVLEIKRYGAVIGGCFFIEGTSLRLRLAFDEFEYLDAFQSDEKWRALALRVGKEISATRKA